MFLSSQLKETASYSGDFTTGQYTTGTAGYLQLTLMFIGIDIGTTTVKAALLDVNALRVGELIAEPFPAPIDGLAPGHFEVEPSAVISTVSNIMEQLLSAAPGCQGVVMCSQMHSLILVNKQGEALSNIITWRDDRALQESPQGSETFFDILSRTISEDDKLRLGNNLAPNRPLAILFTQLQQSKQVLRPLPDKAVAVSLPDFVFSTICESPVCTDYTNAVAASAFDYATRTWHYDLLSALELSCVDWPRIADWGEVVGRYQRNGSKVPCYLPVGDQQCSLLGTLLTEEELSLNISTGSQVSMISRELILSGDFQTVPYFDNGFLKTLVHVPAGRALNALLALLCELPLRKGLVVGDPWAYVEQAVAATGETELIVDLAFFPSSCGDRGSILNISEMTLTVGNLFSAAFRNMASNYFQCAVEIDPLKTWKRVVLSGGLAVKSRSLQSLIRDTFKNSIRIAPLQPDTAMTGLLILASVYAGKFASISEAVLALRQKYSMQIPA